MNTDNTEIANLFKGKFLATPSALAEKFSTIKAFVFDWDGVFNNGIKDENGSSAFSEIDAMGINLLRFNHYLRNGETPVTAIISGEKNKAAFTLAKREHFNVIYYKMVNKIKSLDHLCKQNNIEPTQVAFIFDDVLDFSVAQLCGLRIMVARNCNPLLINFAEKNKLVDYITFADGGNQAVREAVELLTGLSGKYNETIEQRMYFTNNYQQYLEMRNKPQPIFYTSIESEITEQTSL
jgi:3-deoxy-D-manno-octulosonate 8-phosphate phosphatase (KDO 8-P phosphatase)